MHTFTLWTRYILANPFYTYIVWKTFVACSYTITWLFFFFFRRFSFIYYPSNKLLPIEPHPRIQLRRYLFTKNLPLISQVHYQMSRPNISIGHESNPYFYWHNFAKKWNSKSKIQKWSDSFSDFNCWKGEGGNKNKNCQILFLFDFWYVSVNRYGWLNIWISYLVDSQILLSLTSPFLNLLHLTCKNST